MPGHRSAVYLSALLRPLAGTSSNQWPTAVRAHHLTAAEAASLQQALCEDAREYYFSAILSFVEALHGPPQKLYTWATVKLYYSVFYALRSILALHGWCVFYIARPGNKTSCFYIKAASSATARDGAQSTHKAVLKCFSDNLQHLGLLAPIGLVSAPDWLMHLREEANYKNSRFYEPEPPPHFEEVSRRGVRKVVAEYLEPKNDFLAFDPDHAIIAFPLAALRLAAREFSGHHLHALEEDDIATLLHHCTDMAGNLDSLLRALTG